VRLLLDTERRFCAPVGDQLRRRSVRLRGEHGEPRTGNLCAVSRVGETVCNGVRLSWESFGDGAPVLPIAGTGAPPITWQVGGFAPALVESGYRVVTFANRGIEPSDAPSGADDPFKTACGNGGRR
jgi:hypothetical protein